MIRFTGNDQIAKKKKKKLTTLEVKVCSIGVFFGSRMTH